MSSAGPPTLRGWGGTSSPGAERRGEDLAALTQGASLTRGLGRSYGDASLPTLRQPRAASSVLADRILALDASTLRLRAEAGLSLVDLLALLRPRGLWVPAVPGTQFVTLGGMVASDVHGKSHHVEGTFGRHVRGLRLALADGRELEVSRSEEPELFRATLGGMGLTGHILEVELTLQRIPSPWILAETERFDDLDRMIDGLRQAARAWPYTVGWLDTLRQGRGLGRGVLYRGRWAEPAEAPPGPPRPRPRLTVPWDLPSWLLARPLVAAFNEAYFRWAPSRCRRQVVSPEPFFFPLDALLRWNRLYGRRGFTQYQCVVPESERPGGARRVLEELVRRGGGSFLAVIKDCGVEGEGLLSFPRAGISIAVDLPLRAGTQELVDALNERVLEEGGRIYLTKDGLTRREHFARMEPRLEAFLAVKKRWDPEGRLGSVLFDRLMRREP
jgi:decaprenylphospho-beta-D-ribofuranose 2-oxidase